ncbi:MAG: dihydrofolate reductase [Defluviitaleaceae bacterium]|nr:dihydrofolate reductase [Defluviitaleaceae bacterium]
MLSLIAALADDYAIGKNGYMPWNLQDDLKRFAEITKGKTIIMGRKTFESLPGVLPQRKHVIISTSTDLKIDDEMVYVTRDVDSILKKYANQDEEVFVIGGTKIYEAALPYCNKLYLTFVEGDFEADTFFPKFDAAQFEIIERSELFTDNKSKIRFQYITLLKKPGANL